ncbi:MAG: tRNA uridine-5-carboxymethylaminomethyl(34) synthesis GTPase MnmE [Candidatus Symbiothrix sp.]|jgi:tRNA modification GTPase|nr:tRNA uridine-5-carboxymethylaminomethyl(34) synthesis GTPase MnmE [Candidatus Symbiothrix sp.]
MNTQNTICAISTPSGAGGIAVIRVSGHDAFSIVDKIYRPAKNDVSLGNQLPYTLSFGKIVHSLSQGIAGQARNDNKIEEVLDEVLVAVFRAPNSFTGEDTVEISCHGSVFIQQEILKLLLANGCTLAHAGEFTQRAFLNGKMDLSQAEAVADVIASSSAASHRLAMNQMRGGFSKELFVLRSQLLDFVSLIELELDFSEEDVEFADRIRLLELADTIKLTLTKLVNSFSLGNVLKNGIPVVIVGETNVGKSTLLNYLLHEEKAIVSDVHGTTRDVIEDVVNVQGISFRFIDTAGIRDTTDAIESLGIKRTFQKIDQASIVIWMVDATQFNKEIDKLADKIVPRTADKKLLLVINKIDKLSKEEQRILEQQFLPQIKAEHIYLSAKYQQNTEKLESALLKSADLTGFDKQDVIVSNVRHYEALSKALESIQRVEDGLKSNLSGDFISQDIRECMHYLGEITGEISTDEVLGNIFSRFCVGK